MDFATLQHGRESFERRAWAEAYRLLQAADRDAPLDAEDLERLAIAAYLVGRDDECEAFTARAHQAFLDGEDCEAAARAAFWLGFALTGYAAPLLLLPAGSQEPVACWTRGSSTASSAAIC